MAMSDIYMLFACIGIYQDESLPAQTLERMNGVLDDAVLGADAKVGALAAQLKNAVSYMYT